MNKVLEGEILEREPDSGRMADEERSVRRDFWSVLRRAARHVPFMEDLVASYYCALDPATPTRTRAILLGALAYFVLPFDWVPDFILGLGFTDDMAVLWAAITAIRSSITDSHYAAARSALARGQGGEADADGRRDAA